MNCYSEDAKLMIPKDEGHFRCPNCNGSIMARWFTEYGYPKTPTDWQKADCPKCGQPVEFRALTKYEAREPNS